MPDPRPVIVVGAGLAGLSASISALSAGAACVLMLDRAPRAGGNSIKASSGINGAPTRFQPAREPPDDLFLSDTVRSAGSRFAGADDGAKKARENLMGILTAGSAEAVDWLVAMGVDLSVVTQLGGHSVPRTHRGAGRVPPGAAIVGALVDKLKADERFELTTGAEVTRLLTSEEGVTGVEYIESVDGEEKTKYLLGPVIFATGGFAGDTTGLLRTHRPDLAGLPSTNEARPGAHGILAAAGAAFVDMDSVQVHPTGFVDPGNSGAAVKFLAAEMLRGEGGLLLYKGRRFVDELATREVISGRIMTELAAVDEDGKRQWDVTLLLDPGACEKAGSHVGFYLWKGLLRKMKVRDLDDVTRETMRQYTRVVKGEEKDEFGRTAFGHWSWDGDEQAEVCVGRVTPITHFTMGGAVMNERAQVMGSVLGDEDEKVIGGLWAAGEITGGIHGDNRLGGSSLLECVVFGRIAGREAANAVVEV